MLTRKLMNQWVLLIKLKSPYLKFYGRHQSFNDHYGIYVSQMTTDMFHFLLSQSCACFHVHDLSMNMNRTTGSTSGAGNAYCSVLQPIVCRFCHFSFGYCIIFQLTISEYLYLYLQIFMQLTKTCDMYFVYRFTISTENITR